MTRTDTLLWCYVSERLLVPRTGLLALLLITCITLTGFNVPLQFPGLILCTCMFIAAFRLWDDLADLGYDRIFHPQRCLCRAENLTPFSILVPVLLAGVTLLVFLLSGYVQGLAFLALIAGFIALYATTGEAEKLRHLRMSLVLVKYPVFVLVLAREPVEPYSLLMALPAYFLPVLDEVRAGDKGLFLTAIAVAATGSLAWWVLIS